MGPPLNDVILRLPPISVRRHPDRLAAMLLDQWRLEHLNARRPLDR